MKIYHNPRCSKSRAALSMLKEQTQELEIVEYLKTSPDVRELKELLIKLGIKPFDLVRKSETIYKERFSGKEYTDEEWIRILAQHPSLIERPIIVKGDKAVIARPPEKIYELL